MKSPYFKENSSEQNLVEDLSIESIKINGRDMVYIPRTLLNKDELFGEDNSAKFSSVRYVCTVVVKIVLFLHYFMILK